MQINHLRLCTNLARNVTAAWFSPEEPDRDAIDKVLAFIRTKHPRLYLSAAEERGAGVVHRQVAKTVKTELGAANENRHSASEDAPSKTYQGLQAPEKVRQH